MVARRRSRFLELRNSEYPLRRPITNLVFLKASSLVKVRQATTCINSSLSFINSNMAALLIITRLLSNPTMVVG